MKDNWEKINDYLAVLPYFCDEYISISLKEKMSVGTIAAYLYEIYTFFTFLIEQNKADSLSEISIEIIQKITADDINSYIYSFGKKTNGNPRALTALRHFFNYMYITGKIQYNVALMAKTPKKHVSEEKKSSLSISQMIDKVETGDGLSSTELIFRERTSNRDISILRLVILYGLLPAEINSLNQDDIDFENSQLFLQKKVLHIDNITIQYLYSYINEERIPLVSYEPALFIGSRSYRNRLGIRTIEKLVKKYCKTSSSQVSKLHKKQYLEI